ncbi:hypothetical protein ACFLXC_03150 [Chloroflexota bacterium]
MSRGRRSYPWIKLWFDMLSDVKMCRLTVAEKGCWAGILLLAGQSPVRGKLLLTENEPLTVEDMARALHLSSDEVPVLESCISKLEALNSLSWNDGCLEVVNFKKRQDVYPSDMPVGPGELTPNLLRINSAKTPLEEEGRGEKKKRDITSPDGEVPARGKEKVPDPRVHEILKAMREFPGLIVKCGGEALPALEENQAMTAERRKTECGGEALPALEENQAMTADRRETECGGEALPALQKNQAMTADRRRDPIPNYGKEAQFIKKMLRRGFTREEILACWRGKVSQCGGGFVSMVWVNEDIGQGGANAADKNRPRKLKPRNEYTTPEEWRNRQQRREYTAPGEWRNR